jgi:serine/threonine protein kinase
VQVDIWALGISAIEMAETIPPRWTVHPMRVIFLISREDPPRLAEWDKWSLNFHDFVRMCLLKVRSRGLGESEP